MKTPGKMKPLARLRNTAKGKIKHIEIHPAKNSRGGQAFITKIHRNRPPAAQAAMDAGGPYTPEPEPEETPHEDGQDMMQHVANSYGIQPAMDEDANTANDEDMGGEEGD